MVANVGLKMRPMLTSADVNVLIQFEYSGDQCLRSRPNSQTASPDSEDNLIRKLKNWLVNFNPLSRNARDYPTPTPLICFEKCSFSLVSDSVNFSF